MQTRNTCVKKQNEARKYCTKKSTLKQAEINDRIFTAAGLISLSHSEETTQMTSNSETQMDTSPAADIH